MKVDFTFWLALALSISVFINIVTIWYIRRILARFLFISQNLADLVEYISNYKNHLKSIYEMTMFYGDENLQHLIEHTNVLSEVLEQYDDVYSISIPDENEEVVEEVEQKELIDGETKISQENVFYAGTRRRNN